MIRVKKRNGKLEILDITKIQKQTKDSTDGLEGTSQSEIELDAKIHFVDGISSEDIQKTLIRVAVEKIDIDRPNWTFTAARLFIYDLYHRVGKNIQGEKGNPYCHISKYLAYGEEKGRILKGLSSKFDLDTLNEAIVPSRDFLFNYLGIKTLFDRYLLKNEKGECFELPQQMFMGVSMFLASKETEFDKQELIDFNLKKFGKKNSEYLKAVRTYFAIQFYNVISTFEVMLATPTLSNARTPRHQMSSCFIGSTPDNIEGIFDGYKEMSLLSKYGGGIGWDWNQVRAMASFIAGHKGAAGGTIPFLKITNDIAIAVDQLGTRKGAIAVYIEPWHRDIEDFLDIKKNSGEERRRAHDLVPALWINDLFMERVLNKKDFSLFSPDDVPELSELYGDEFKAKYEEYEANADIPRKVIPAVDLWKKALTSYNEVGSPFLTFKDTANKVNPNPHNGPIRSSNLCTEIFQSTKPNKYRTKVNFADGTHIIFEEEEFVTVDGNITKKAKNITSLDTINDKEIFIVDKDKEDGETAVCNLASVNLSKINTKEDFERVIPIAIRILDNVIDLNFYPLAKVKKTNLKTRAIGLGVMGEAQMLAEKGIVWGSQAHFELIDEVMEIFSYNAILNSANLAKERGSYPTFKGSNWEKGILPIDLANENAIKIVDRKRVYDWNNLKEKVKQGMRNGYLMAIAPTSSISILVGTTQAIEPVYRRKWFEENLSGLIPVVAPNLSPKTWECYKPAFDIDQIEVIKAAAIRQKWLDQGQSTNIFLRLDKITGALLHKIYVSAWKYGLKSTYYLRTESPDAKKAEMVADRALECEGCQ